MSAEHKSAAQTSKGPFAGELRQQSKTGCTGFPLAKDPHAGDFADCVSSSELDDTIGPLIGGPYITSRAIYDMSKGALAVDTLLKMIGGRLHKFGRVFLVLWTRNHWATAIGKGTSVSESVWTIFDSAPSEPTRRDFESQFNRLQLPVPTLRCHARQERGSNECGLHVIFVAVWISLLPEYPGPDPRLHYGKTVSLKAWRKVLPDIAQAGGLRTENVQQFIHTSSKARRQLVLLGAAVQDAKPRVELGDTRRDHVDEPQKTPVRIRGRVVTMADPIDDAETAYPNDRSAVSDTQLAPAQGGVVEGGARTKAPGSRDDPVPIDDSQSQSDLPQISVPYKLLADQPFVGEYDEKRAVLTWAQETAAENAAENAKDVQKATAQMEEAIKTLSYADRVTKAARIRESFALRTKALNFIWHRSLLFIPRAPDYVRSQKTLWDHIVMFARNYERQQDSKVHADDLQYLAKAGEEGEMLDTRIITAIIDTIRSECPDWTFVTPTQLRQWGGTGRDVDIDKQFAKNVAVVIHTGESEKGGHFTLAIKRDNCPSIEWYDSLAGAIPRHPTDEATKQRIQQFRMLLRNRGIVVDDYLRPQCCGVQARNACGIESLRNLGFVIFGATNMSRELIRKAFMTKSEEERRKIWRSAWVVLPRPDADATRPPPPAQSARPPTPKPAKTAQPASKSGRNHGVSHETEQPKAAKPNSNSKREGDAPRAETAAPTPTLAADPPKRAKTAATTANAKHTDTQAQPKPPAETRAEAPVKKRVHNPYASVLPSEDEVKAHAKQQAGRPCCGNEKIVDNMCWQHHPRVKQAPAFCQAPSKSSALRKQAHCGNHALVVMSADGSQGIYTTKHCWHHLGPGRDAMIAALTNNDPPRAERDHAAQDATDAPRGTSTNSALSHTTVRQLLQSFTPGDHVVVDTTPHGAKQRVRRIGRLIIRPSQLKPGKIEWKARWCTTCDVWHATAALYDDGESIPSVDMMYNGISKPTPDMIRIAKEPDELQPDCECADFEEGSDCDNVDAEPLQEPSPENMESYRDQLALQPLGEQVNNVGPSSLDLWHVVKDWHIYNEQPPLVHNIAWTHVTEATRVEQRRWLLRLRHHGHTEELARMPFPRAVVEIVLRAAAEKSWKWSTISSKLSTVKSAVINVNLFSACRRPGPDLGKDNYYAAVQSRAQRLARTHAIHPMRSTPLSHETYVRLISNLTHGPRALLVANWWLAARTGDVRRLDPRNVEICFDDQHDGYVPVKVLFTRGKGAHFWGPYSIHTEMPLSEAKLLEEIRSRRIGEREETLFTLADQATLSSRIGTLPDSSLRSIRRGALNFFARCGASDEQLQKLSGHRRHDTLMRYLGWGQRSSEADNAARERTALVNRALLGAGVDQPARQHHPMWMGEHSGFNGTSGRRTAPPPELFPRQAPSSRDVGIETETASKREQESWPLHVKPEIVPMDVEKIPKLIKSSELREQVQKGLNFLKDPTLLGATWTPLMPAQLPKTSFTAEHWKTMFDGGKCLPLRVSDDKRQVCFVNPDGSSGKPFDIRSACKGFPTPQPAKQRLRPVFEPLHNASIKHDERPELHYPNRQSRRAQIARCRYAIEFDFSAWFDQAQIANETLDHYVCRATPTTIETSAGREETFEFFALTRCAMGSTFAAHTMQNVTWGILEPLLDPSGPFAGKIVVFTMIDNVLIASDDERLIVEAVRVFLKRCKQFGAQLNSDYAGKDIAELADKNKNDITFLGEVYRGSGVRNTDRNINKLREAFARIQDALTNAKHGVTLRHIAAVIGLCTWMSHTIELHLRDHFKLVRLFSRIAQSACTSRWDDPALVDANMVSVLSRFIGPIIQNNPKVPTVYEPIERFNDNQQYDAVVIVDACASGCGAYVQFPKSGRVIQIRRGWGRAMHHSAQSEPLAAAVVMDYLQKHHGDVVNVALVSDHTPLPAAQRRPSSGNGAFSSAFFLNEMFRLFYRIDSAKNQIFYVKGELNPADGPSRNTFIGDIHWHTEDVTEIFAFPPLRSFQHPHLDTRANQRWWHV